MTTFQFVKFALKYPFMDIWLDNRETDKQFREILTLTGQYRNGETAAAMQRYGIRYRMNAGASLTDLKEIAGNYHPSHVLALKLWNKQWRETMILATMIDDPGQVTEEQMDFWTKSFENSEIAEQASANLWWRTPFAFAKALEWCRGKKHWVRYTGVHLSGRLAMMDKASPDEMFDLFFGEFLPLSRDPALSAVLYRSLILMVNRSGYLKEKIKEWTDSLRTEGQVNSLFLASEMEKGIKESYP